MAISIVIGINPLNKNLDRNAKFGGSRDHGRYLAKLKKMGYFWAPRTLLLISQNRALTKLDIDWTFNAIDVKTESIGVSERKYSITSRPTKNKIIHPKSTVISKSITCGTFFTPFTGYAARGRTRAVRTVMHGRDFRWIIIIKWVRRGLLCKNLDFS